MKIGLIDVDGHNFPNLALMNISVFHKIMGDTVEDARCLSGSDKRCKGFDTLEEVV